MGTLAVFSGPFFPLLMTILLLIYAVLAIADLFKRHLLSNTVIYWITMLLAPLAAASAVAAPIAELLSETSNEKMNWGKIILFFIGGAALLLLAAAVYIRGHIAPLNKASENYGNNKKYFAAKRLIKVGCAGTLIYAVPFIVMSYEIIMFMLTGAAAFANVIVNGGIGEAVLLLLILPLLLFMPIANVVIIFIICFLGIEFTVWGITAIAVLLADILISNGCIRYILTTDMTKGKKALWIFLSLIPVFNFVYGIKCLKKINSRLKETQFS